MRCSASYVVIHSPIRLDGRDARGEGIALDDLRRPWWRRTAMARMAAPTAGPWGSASRPGWPRAETRIRSPQLAADATTREERLLDRQASLFHDVATAAQRHGHPFEHGAGEVVAPMSRGEAQERRSQMGIPVGRALALEEGQEEHAIRACGHARGAALMSSYVTVGGPAGAAKTVSRSHW